MFNTMGGQEPPRPDRPGQPGAERAGKSSPEPARLQRSLGRGTLASPVSAALALRGQTLGNGVGGAVLPLLDILGNVPQTHPGRAPPGYQVQDMGSQGPGDPEMSQPGSGMWANPPPSRWGGEGGDAIGSSALPLPLPFP